MNYRSTSDGWGVLIIVIHWITALTVVGMFLFGLWMVELDYYDGWYRKAPDLHKGIGISLFMLTLMRLVWRMVSITPDALSSHKFWERKAATVAHWLLYLLLFLVMVSGYLISTADGRGISYFGMFEIPATLSGLDQQEDIAGVIHLVLASTLIGVALFHAAAALKYHFFDRDRTLMRMLGL